MNDFERQNEIGKIGEDFVLNNKIIKITKKYKYVYDVRELPIFQMNDIDFILSKNQFDFEDINQQVEFVWKVLKKHNSDDYTTYDEIAIEVKTDTETKGKINKDGTIGTNNICLEITSHDKAGCVGETRADVILYICLDEHQQPLSEYYSINVYKMRKYIRENCELVNKKNKFFIHNTIKSSFDKSMNLICGLDYLLEDKIITAKKLYETL